MGKAVSLTDSCRFQPHRETTAGFSLQGKLGLTQVGRATGNVPVRETLGNLSGERHYLVVGM